MLFDFILYRVTQLKLFTGVRNGTSCRYSDWLKPNSTFRFTQLLGFWCWNNFSTMSSEIRPQYWHSLLSDPYFRNLNPRNRNAPSGGVAGPHINQSRHSVHWSAVCNKPWWRWQSAVRVGSPVTQQLLKPHHPQLRTRSCTLGQERHICFVSAAITALLKVM
jgi:hypothetical protein